MQVDPQGAEYAKTGSRSGPGSDRASPSAFITYGCEIVCAESRTASSFVSTVDRLGRPWYDPISPFSTIGPGPAFFRAHPTADFWVSMTALHISAPALRRIALRRVVVLLGVCVAPVTVGAQGPAAPGDPRPVQRAAATPDAARLLAANVARLGAASVPRAATRPVRPFAAFGASAYALRDSIVVSVARTAIGTRYATGGQSFDRGFDCSGLVRYVMTALHVAVPRTAAQQAGTGVAIGRDPSQLRPGDLLTFGKSSRGVSHVGIYVGNGRYVHASSVAGRVIESDIDRPAARRVKSWRGSRRVLSSANTDSTRSGG